MRIRKIEITGFKSFCDRTLLSIDRPVTAIVGPNGCGKSNVVDAIRWAMGEQSARQLRGRQMTDIIFGGSESRGPCGLAEVSLTFENDDGAAPPPYHSYGEIVVTRRLLRDGTSDYYLNKTPCRLRDVTDLFLGTGVGSARAYSIIEQGRIGLVVTSKPEDRRYLIEEAAGITRYKAKKRAAERKMEWTRQNLLRVSDVVAEIEKRLGSLRRQAQKAERYKRYRAEMREIELWSASHRFLGLLADQRVHGELLAEALDRRERLDLRLAAREAQIEAEQLACAEEERRLASAQERQYELDHRIRLGESQQSFQRREVEELGERGREARAEIEGLTREATQLAADAGQLAGELAECVRAAGGQEDELVAREQALRELRQQVAAVEEEMSEVRRREGAARTEVARAESTQTALARRREEIDGRRRRLEEEAGSLEQRERALAGTAHALGRMLGELKQLKLQLGDQREKREQRLQQLQAQVTRGEVELETLRTELHRRRSRLTSLREIEDRYEGFQRGVRAIMQQAGATPRRRGIHGLVADIVQAPAELEAAVEAVLGERLGHIIVESQEVGVEAIEYLKARAEGRSGFIPLGLRCRGGDDQLGGSVRGGGGQGSDEREGGEARRTGSASRRSGAAAAAGRAQPGRIAGAADAADAGVALCGLPGVRGRLLELIGYDRRFERVASYLLGDVVVVDDLRQALELWRGDSQGGGGIGGRTLVTLDGELVDQGGVITGGSRELAGAGVLQQKREMRELEEIITALDQQYQASFAAHVERKSEIGELSRALEQLRSDSHSGEMEILTHEKDVTRTREELARLGERRRGLGAELDELAAGQAEATAEAVAAAAALAAGHDEAERMAARLVELAAEALRLGRLAEESAQAVTEVKVRVAAAEEKRRALEQRLGASEAQRQDRLARKERLAQGIVAGETRTAELRAQTAALGTELLRLAEDSRQQASELAAARATYDQRLLRRSQAEAEVRGVRQERDKLVQAVSQLEMHLQASSIDRRHLEEVIAERYQLELRREIGAYHMRPLIGEQEETRLGELRDLIARMGDINLTAIDECNELSARHEFLSVQKRDLEAALDQLEKAIAKINKVSRARFRETFDAVNARFQDVFPRLFGGGRAYLQLTDEANLLESGVEIIAKPPGKKPQSLELLSGGEKALTAVSLVFAIFLITPSPFCLLDEVDAPLDEANVGRFNDMVREMTDRSQFILITHSRRTMEKADSLYGITMEEPGISKLVAVNLSTTGQTRRRAA